MRFVKGAKWAYGWVVVTRDRRIPIPPAAWKEYGFRCCGEAIFTPGSRASGGFGLSTPALRARMRPKLRPAPKDAGSPESALAELGRSRFADGCVSLPPRVDVKAGARLLAVRGSRYALGFVARGRIHDEASAHPDLLVFKLAPEEAGQEMPPDGG